MIIRVKKTANERQLAPQHRTYSRREFIERGIFTTTMAAALPSAIMTGMARSAFADTLTCPPASLVPGGVAQIHMSGGGSASAGYLMTASQLNMATVGSNAANLWGVLGGAALTECFSNGGVDSTHPFGATLLTPPPGFTQAQWNTTLKQVSYAGNYGAASADDGGGENLGHIGSISGVSGKKSNLNTDLMIKTSGITSASWVPALAGGAQQVGTDVSNVTSAILAQGFGITPPAGTSAGVFANTTTAANALGALFSSVFGTNSAGVPRAGAQTALNSVSCGFIGDAPMASATFGASLFTPTSITALSGSGLTLANMTPQELAFLAAYYQSAIGELGGVIADVPGADYHGQSVQNTISPYDQQIGNMVRMWLAAASIAKQKSVMMITTNGSPGPNGVQNVQITGVSGGAATITVNGPSAQGDDGGSFSAHQILTYTPPGGSIPNLISTGTINSDGTVKIDSRFASVPASIGGLYATALHFINGTPSSAFAAVLASKGISVVVDNING